LTNHHKGKVSQRKRREGERKEGAIPSLPKEGREKEGIRANQRKKREKGKGSFFPLPIREEGGTEGRFGKKKRKGNRFPRAEREGGRNKGEEKGGKGGEEREV